MKFEGEMGTDTVLYQSCNEQTQPGIQVIHLEAFPAQRLTTGSCRVMIRVTKSMALAESRALTESMKRV